MTNDSVPELRRHRNAADAIGHGAKFLGCTRSSGPRPRTARLRLVCSSPIMRSIEQGSDLLCKALGIVGTRARPAAPARCPATMLIARLVRVEGFPSAIEPLRRPLE